MAVDDVEAAISAGLADMALGDLGSATGAQPSDLALEDAQIPTAVRDPRSGSSISLPVSHVYPPNLDLF
jgi:hypothetical protein